MGALVSIVLPIWNQAGQIANMMDDYAEHLATLPYGHELILVVNGAADESLDACHQAARQRATIRVLSLPESGWGRAVRAGLADARGDLLCYTNSARTRGVDLAKVIRYAAKNPGTMIKATRHLRDGVVRQVGSLLFNVECRVLFDLSVWDVNATPKVFPHALLQQVTLTSPDDLLDIELVASCRRVGYPMLEVPIEFTARRGGLSTTNWRSAGRLYWGAWRLWRGRSGRGR